MNHSLLIPSFEVILNAASRFNNSRRARIKVSTRPDKIKNPVTRFLIITNRKIKIRLTLGSAIKLNNIADRYLCTVNTIKSHYFYHFKRFTAFISKLRMLNNLQVYCQGIPFSIENNLFPNATNYSYNSSTNSDNFIFIWLYLMLHKLF